MMSFKYLLKMRSIESFTDLIIVFKDLRFFYRSSISRTSRWVSFLIVFLYANQIYAQSQSIQSVFQDVDRFIISKDYQAAKSKIDSLISQLDTKRSELSHLKAINRLLQVQIKLGTYSDAVKTGNQLLSKNPKLLDSAKEESIWFYALIGNAYRLTQSNVEKGLIYLNQALERYNMMAVSNRDIEFYIMDGIGGCYYYLSQYEKAISFFEACQKLIDEQTDKTRMALNFRSLGNAYWGLQDYENAAKYYDESLDMLYQTEPVDRLNLGRVLHAKGYIYMDQQKYRTANQVFTEASQIISRNHPAVHPTVVWVYGDVGRSFLLLKEYDSALHWIQKALNANLFESQEQDVYKNSVLASINDDFQHFMLLKLKGQSFAGKYKNSRNEKDLKGMIDAFLLADQQVDNIRKSIPKAEDQSTISYYANELFSNAVDAFVEIHELAPDLRLMELAHYFMEKQKITQVHLKFLETSAKVKNLLPPEILQQEQEILDKISSLKTRSKSILNQVPDSIISIKQGLFEAQESYERFVNQVEEDYPAYHTSRFNLEVVSSSQLQQLLNANHPERAIISYYNFGGNFRTSFITKDTLLVQSVSHDLNVGALTKSLRSRLIDPDQAQAESDTLSNLLLGNLTDLLTNCKQITFIQDPALQLIPMEVLTYQGSYLLEKFDISYDFSTTLFASKKPQPKSFNFSGFAPSFESTELQSLPGAEKEIAVLETFFEGTNHLGTQATELTFKQSIHESGLIHLATHAIVDDHNPESSYLQFSPSKTEEEDGKLHFFEIYNLDLNAQLVTLSACNTGFGKIQNGEGVMSLSRAFAYTGVSSTVMSLWSASDKSTPKLMSFFYENLKEGQHKDAALNNARKQYLAQASGKARHPYYWGGFVLIGDSSPLQQPKNPFYHRILATCLLLIGFWVFRKRLFNK